MIDYHLQFRFLQAMWMDAAAEVVISSLQLLVLVLLCLSVIVEEWEPTRSRIALWVLHIQITESRR